MKYDFLERHNFYQLNKLYEYETSLGFHGITWQITDQLECLITCPIRNGHYYLKVDILDSFDLWRNIIIVSSSKKSRESIHWDVILHRVVSYTESIVTCLSCGREYNILSVKAIEANPREYYCRDCWLGIDGKYKGQGGIRLQREYGGYDAH